MQGVWLENETVVWREDLEVPELADGEALIRLRLAGICNTDLEMVRGYYPFTGIMGHEFVGEVVKSEDDSLRGKRVVGEINIGCGTCSMCAMGFPNHCKERSVLGLVGRDGCFAEFLTLPAKNLYPIPGSVSDEAAVFVEPLAAALEIQEQIEIKPRDKILVVGAGRLGLLIAQTLSIKDCDLSVVVRHQFQRDLLETMGVTAITEQQISHRDYDIVVEVTGNADGFSMAQKAIRPRGTIVVKSTYTGDLTVNFSKIVVDEITVVGSRCGPFQAAMNVLESGLLNPQSLITARYPLREVCSAFDHAAKPGVLKVLLIP